MHSSVVTVFNQYETSTGLVWYPHVLSGVHLEKDRARMIAKYGPESSDSAEMYVRYAEVDGVISIKDADGKVLPFLSPKAWAQQVNDELADSITFQDGDFFMEGAWNGADVINDADYSGRRDDGFYTYMNRTLDNVFLITSVGGPYKVIKHFEIMGA